VPTFIHFAVLASLPIGAAALVRLVLRLLVAADARRVAAQARARVEATHDADGDIALVRGTIVVSGDGLHDVRSRHSKAAAQTVWLSKHRLSTKERWLEASSQAQTVAIDTGEDVVMLRAPLTVGSGSELQCTGERTLTDRGHATRSHAVIADGDNVIAVGVFGEEATDATAADYRTRPLRRTLKPLEGEAVIEIVSTSPPAVSISWGSVRKHPAVLLVGLAFCVPGCSAALDYNSLDCASDCEAGGYCGTLPRWLYNEPADVKYDIIRGRHFRCGATAAADCRNAKLCAAYGSCSLVDASCVAATPGDCAHTLGCLESGLCTPVDGKCKTARADDCLHTENCRAWGKCTPTDGSCEARTDDDCRASRDCRSIGYCSARDNRCVALKNEDCARLGSCSDAGRCTAVAGRCQASQQDCARSEGCRKHGRCRAINGSCEATNSEDCERSEDCANDRRCRYDEATRACALGIIKCSESAACRIHGHCSYTYVCVAGSDRDCEASHNCKERGACSAIDGTCKKSCADHRGCREDGRCTREGSRCIATSDADCTSSTDCAKSGHCGVSEGVCGTATSESCSQSRLCLLLGYCTSAGDSCQRTSNADCAKTIGCAQTGACSLQDGRCIVAKDADCKATSECKQLGRCRAVEGRCAVADDADCQASEVCRRYGWCSTLEYNGYSLGTDVTSACFKRPPS
jgi:hypothetical protein